MLKGILGEEMKVAYNDYLEAFGLLTEEEITAWAERKREEKIRIKADDKSKQADVMNWLYSENYTEELAVKVTENV